MKTVTVTYVDFDILPSDVTDLMLEVADLEEASDDLDKIVVCDQIFDAFEKDGTLFATFADIREETVFEYQMVELDNNNNIVMKLINTYDLYEFMADIVEDIEYTKVFEFYDDDDIDDDAICEILCDAISDETGWCVNEIDYEIEEDSEEE